MSYMSASVTPGVGVGGSRRATFVPALPYQSLPDTGDWRRSITDVYKSLFYWFGVKHRTKRNN